MPLQPSLNQQGLCSTPLCMALFIMAILITFNSAAQFEETAFGNILQNKIDSVGVVLKRDSNYIPQIPITEPIPKNLHSAQRLSILAEKIALTNYYEDLDMREERHIVLSSIMPDDLERSPKHSIWWHKSFSSVLMNEADIPGSIRELEAARNLALNINDRWELCNIERMKAFTYHYMGNDISAKEHFQIVVDEYTDVGGDDYILCAYMLTELDCESGDLEGARRNLEKLNLIEPDTTSDTLNRFRTLGYAMYYLASEKCDSALTNFEKLFEIYQERPDKTWPPWLLSQISLSHLCAGDVNRAIKVGKEGLKISLASSYYKEELDNREALYRAYLKANRSDEALEQLQRVVELRESIGNAKKSIAVANTIMQNEFERREQSESLLRQEEERVRELEYKTQLNKEKNRRNIFLFSSILVIVLSGGLWSRLRYIRRTKNVIETEKERSDQLLLNILPQKVAEELKEKGESKAQLFEETTVLFTDFQQFTEISEKFSPSELVDEINACFKAFDLIIEKYNIEKIKTIGDAYMAAAGLNVPRTSSPKDVVIAAFEMQEFVERRKELRTKEGLLSFQMRVGIHTGPVVAGIVGVKKFQYDIWGDTVNTASRIETSGQVAKVNISEATYSYIKDEPEFEFTPRGKIQVKGKGELDMYFVSLRTNS